MKRLILLVLGLMPLSVLAQKTFTVIGYVKGLKNTDKVYYYYNYNNTEKSDSLKVKDGHFQFSGVVNAPSTVLLTVNKNPMKDQFSPEDMAKTFDFYVDSGKLLLNSKDSLKNITIANSSINKAYSDWKALQEPIKTKLRALNKKMTALTEEQKKDEKLTQPLMDREKQYLEELTATGIEIAKRYPRSQLSLLALQDAAQFPDLNEQAIKAFMGLSPELKNQDLGKRTKLLLASASINQIDKYAADFTQYTPNGKTVKLSDYKGKYVLVDFWASWCKPCRAENPNVLAAYNKYKDQGFNVLGVSFDYPGKKASWVKAINDDKMPWTQVSDLKGWDNYAAALYGIREIPANILVGPDGKIIAKDLHGEDLTNKLAEVFNKTSK